ncbi:hypothetical protein M8J77_019588 [Diaphorina citri]|nr:hypothetical protein M8J77_019588 [Diaphorina citri]
MSAFENHLSNLRTEIRKHGNKRIIVGGDFNAKSTVWGSPFNCGRGNALEELLAEINFIILNRGNTPTFVRNQSESFIDVTFCTPSLVSTIEQWEVLDEENLTDHGNIKYTLSLNTRVQKKRHINDGWIIKEDKKEEFKKILKDKIETHSECAPTPETLVQIISTAANETFRKKKNTSTRGPIYWWNESIGNLRKNCLVAKRKLTRDNRKANVPDEVKRKNKDVYKEEREKLRKAIGKAKDEAWDKLCVDIDRDTWGKGYKIVREKMKIRPFVDISDEERLAQARKLFPMRNKITWEKLETEEKDIPLFTMEELAEVIGKAKKRKSPGPDNITMEMVDLLFKSVPNYLLSAYNELLKKGTFPDIWKRSKLVLLDKGKNSADGKATYRPICLLDSLGKTLEALIRTRIEKRLSGQWDLSSNQFGFRKGRSTVDAINKVKSLCRAAKGRRKACAMVGVDVRNAFNSTPWDGIIAELKRRKMPPYLINISCSYLSDRKLLITQAGDAMDLTCGVPQGGVLAATLWNIYYDNILSVKFPPGINAVAYADDLALIAEAKSKQELQANISLALGKVNDWITSKGLELAPEKTEAIVLNQGRKMGKITVKIGNTQIESTDKLKYLGVMFSKNLNMGEHVKWVSKKAERTALALNRIMPNRGGPSNKKRVVLSSIVHSILLYGAPFWAEVMKYRTHVNRLEQVQRKSMIRIIRSYRTVSTVALQVLSGTIPIDLLVVERERIYEELADTRLVPLTSSEKKSLRQELRDETMATWQGRWNEQREKGQWTKSLIPNIKVWIQRRHGQVSYEMCQLLTGHGSLNHYLKRMGKRETDTCNHCQDIETAEHALLKCPRWSNERAKCAEQVGKDLRKENILEIMLSSASQWNAIDKLCIAIVRAKELEARSMENSGLVSVQITG